MERIQVEIGLRIAQVREMRSKKLFAESIGTTPQNLLYIEAGAINTTVGIIAKICSIYNINANWLLFGVGEMNMLEAIKAQKRYELLERLVYIQDEFATYKARETKY